MFRKQIPLGNAASIRRAGVIHVDAFGMPLSVIPRGDGFAGFVRICPHDWIVMDAPAVEAFCIVCPVHLATFDVRSGAIVERKGKKMRQGLRAVMTHERDGEVFAQITSADWLYRIIARFRQKPQNGKKQRPRRVA